MKRRGDRDDDETPYQPTQPAVQFLPQTPAGGPPEPAPTPAAYSPAIPAPTGYPLASTTSAVPHPHQPSPPQVMVGQAPGQHGAPHLSPDGQWRWNGSTWVPTAAPRGRGLVALWVALGLVGVLVVVGVLAAIAIPVFLNQRAIATGADREFWLQPVTPVAAAELALAAEQIERRFDGQDIGVESVAVSPAGEHVVVRFDRHPTALHVDLAAMPLSQQFRPVVALGDITGLNLPADIEREFRELSCGTTNAPVRATPLDPTRPVAVCPVYGSDKALLGPATMTSADVAGVSAVPPGAGETDWAVQWDFTPSGGEALHRVTTELSAAAWPRDNLALVVDGVLFVTASFAEPVTDDGMQIVGYDASSARTSALLFSQNELTVGFEVDPRMSRGRIADDAS